MAKEVELKIRVLQPQRLQDALVRVAQREGSYRKKDVYFRGPGGSFRVRDTDGSLVACRKEKTIEQGIEVSRELEFAVPDLPVFTAFCEGLGYRIWYTKEKVGQSWRWGDILIEEGEVLGLGGFAEFEILLAEDADDSAVERARGTLWKALEALGIPRSDVEPRTYSELLGKRG